MKPKSEKVTDTAMLDWLSEATIKQCEAVYAEAYKHRRRGNKFETAFRQAIRATMKKDRKGL
jgi:hypothetical protein